MPTAFVTGITGQTGSYLADILLARGYRVVGLVRGGDETRQALEERTPGLELLEGDLGDGERLADLVARVAPDAVFNLGGLSSVAASWERPLDTALITAVPPAVLLDAALGVQRREDRRVSFVQASSAEIFGSPSESPQNEETPVRPVNPYGAAKAYGHHLVASYRSMGLAASSCILYNHESPRRPETFVTRKITRTVARISLGLETELVLGSLDARRDWGWAPDYAAAMQLVAEAEPDDYVIATGEAHSVEDFVAAAFAAAGVVDWRGYVKQDAAFVRPKEATEFVGDSSRLRARTGWAPTRAFEQIVAAMVENDLAIESTS
ncbi:MAG: GDP-mannose 4,6-dehydratase [Glaciihabitans sp.]|nr:GDP-mannose 4,6-dehydratase [Glaciihabitans sp.]